MKKISGILLSFILLFSFACKKSSIEQTQPLLKGDVVLTNESGEFFKDNSGMTVSIENSNPLISTITDSRGGFVLPFDPALTSFTLVYTKPQFGTFKRYITKDDAGKFYYWNGNDKFESGQTNEDLSEKSTVTINSFHAEIRGDTLKITCNISSAGNGQKYIQLLSQKDLPNISISTVDQTRINWAHKLAVKNGDNIFNFCLKCSVICNDWVSGDAVYLTAYGDSYYSNAYVDRSTNHIIMPNLNLNINLPPASVVVP